MNSEENVLAALVENVRQAMIDVNQSVLENLTTNELNYGHSDGKVENKSEFVKAITSGQDVYKTIDLTNQTITIIDDIALVRHKFAAETINHGKPGAPRIGVFQVWKKEQQQWKMLARQAFKLQF